MGEDSIRIIGIDPGLQRTGWGIIQQSGHRLSHLAHGTVSTSSKSTLSQRLLKLHEGLCAVIDHWQPAQAAVELTFVSKDASATLKLGHARGMALLAPAAAGLDVAEYAPNLVKKTVVGSGHAAKHQILAMVNMLLPRCGKMAEDEADALAIAITHAHHAGAAARIARKVAAT